MTNEYLQENEFPAFCRPCRFCREAAAYRSWMERNKRSEVETVCEYIRENCEQHLTWEILGDLVYMSPSYLRALFKADMEMNLHEYQMICKLEKAKELLEHTEKSVAEVGRDVGIESPSYFCALFRERYGMTPNQYGRQLY